LLRSSPCDANPPGALLLRKAPLWSYLLRTILVFGAAKGFAGIVREIVSVLGVFKACWTRQFVWAVPMHGYFLASAIGRVVCRRLTGRRRSPRWNAAVELAIEIATPPKAFIDCWEGYTVPAIRIMTLLDYYGRTFAWVVHRGVSIEAQTQVCPRPLWWVWFESAKAATGEMKELVVLYLHGGGYWAFTGSSHMEYVARLVKVLNSDVPAFAKACVVDYRRAGDHPWPAQLEDAVSSYKWLRAGCGYHASQIVLAGDSAGGGLCLATLLALRDAGEELPMCATVVSPFTDLSRTEEQYKEYHKHVLMATDFVPPIAATMSSYYYMHGSKAEDARHPLISPKYGELHALPPILLQAGQDELLVQDAIETSRRLHAYGGNVKLEVYPEMPHIFPMLAPLGCEDAQKAIHSSAKFVRQVSMGDDIQQDGQPLRFGPSEGGRTRSFRDLRALAGSPILPSSSSSPVLAGLSMEKHVSPRFFSRQLN